MTVKRYLIGFGAAVAVGAAIYGYGQLQYSAGKAAAKEAKYIAELEKYKQAADGLLAASGVAESSLIKVGVRHDEFTQNYQNLAEFDCYADADRMQHIYRIYTPTVTR